jgi:hypothetical protein
LLGGWLGVLVLTSTATCAEEPASRRSQSARKQTAETDFDTLHRMVLPQDNELKWVSIPWLTSITQARHRAAVEGKPLFVFADTGAGFADALGLC